MLKKIKNNHIRKILTRYPRITRFTNRFFESGTQLGWRCSGYGVYPNGEYCHYCSDCEGRWSKIKRK